MRKSYKILQTPVEIWKPITRNIKEINEKTSWPEGTLGTGYLDLDPKASGKHSCSDWILSLNCLFLETEMNTKVNA